MNKLAAVRDSLDFRVVRMGETVVPEQGTYVPVKEGLIHVWSARYSALDHYQPLLSAQISPDDMLKAAEFKKPGDARRYILRHGMVRTILGHYICEDPEKLRFIQGMTGKPDLDPDATIHNILFSLSHTDKKVCLGISRESEIGLDIVKTDPHFPYQETGQYLFSPGEWLWITETVPEDRPLRFFRIWSVKEALLKAMGSTVNMMKEADISGIMADRFLDGFYPVQVGEKEIRFFIHESKNDGDHHCALAAMPAMETGSRNGYCRTGSG